MNQDPKTLSPAARAAKAIREELKGLFPTVKFSIRSRRFSMGNSVEISWTDGPTDKEVSEVVGKYEAGSFDPMQDMYVYDNRNNGLPQAKYVNTQRTLSEAFRAVITADLANRYDVDFSDNQAVFYKFAMWPEAVIWKQAETKRY